MNASRDDPSVLVDRVHAEHRAPTAATDRVETGMGHDRLPLLNGTEKGDFSPVALLHPDIAAARDALRGEARVIPDRSWLESEGFNYARSNGPDTLALPAEYGCEEPGCDCGDVGGHTIATVRNMHGPNPIAEFRTGADAAVSGPHGTREVHLHDPQVPMYTPPLPWRFTDDGAVTPSFVALPVLPGYSIERVARMAMDRYASRCYWTGRWTWTAEQLARTACSGGTDWGLLVSAHTVTHVFPMCGPCRWGLAKDVTPHGWERGYGEDDGRLDYVSGDGWDRAAGYPSDRNR